ncbi:hypothetical protein LguiB_017866 [Lonicera macranthoides]
MAITQLMGVSEEAEHIKKREEEMAVAARGAITEGGSSYNQLTTLIEDVRACVLEKKEKNTTNPSGKEYKIESKDGPVTKQQNTSRSGLTCGILCLKYRAHHGERYNSRLAEAISCLIGNLEEAGQIREQAKEIGKTTKQPVGEGGSSYTNITTLTDEIKAYSF